MKNNTDLRRDVLDELEWEPSLDATEIAVTARDGVVTLAGSVLSYSEKVTAEKVIKRVHGVKAIANDLEVRIRGVGERTDTDIAEGALDALVLRAGVPRDRIKVSVSTGWVTLDGDVDWKYQSDAAEEAVRYLLGVRGVSNQILVKPRISEADVKTRIEAAFRRSAEMDAKKISVETEDGIVTLRGTVHSWAEREGAENSAWAAPGVHKVENLIKIAPWES
jgi:osmotically-inducible protein OsmY